MARPEIARWVDVKFLTDEISKSLNLVALKLSQELDEDDVTIVRNIYKTTLKSGSVDLSPEFKPIYDRFTYELEAKRKELSNYITKKEEQKKLQKRVQAIVAEIEGVKVGKIKKDSDITKCVASSLTLFAAILRKTVNVSVKIMADTISTLAVRRPEIEPLRFFLLFFIYYSPINPLYSIGFEM